MLNKKPSKYILCLLAGVWAAASCATTASAEYIYQSNRSVRDMMERRSQSLPLRNIGDIQKQKMIIRKTPNGMVRSIPHPQMSCTRTAVPSKNSCALQNTVSPAVFTPLPAETTSVEVLMQPAPMVKKPHQRARWSLFSRRSRLDKDGSLFPGGGCETCRKSGPLIDTGPCESCQKSGPLIDTGPCESCRGPLIDTGPCESCRGPLIDTGPCESCKIAEVTPIAAPVPQCCSMAPLYLAHVDFNLDESLNVSQNKIGNYRFRIFGCRRYEHDAILNHGRVLEKNMDFNRVFEESVQDCYNIVKMPEDLCLQTTPSPLPEYVLTAEINDVYMNVCDGYDWDNAAAQNARTGSAEIKVKWRLTNLTKDTVLWEGTTTGYSDLTDGDAEGEIKLIEDAFADAVSNLRVMPGFEEQLMVRLTPEELTAQREALIDEEIALDPARCNYKPAFEQCQPQTQCVTVDDTWAETQVVDTMCIVDRPPYETLDAPNLYKIRASIVEISAPNAKKGAGVIISENFILTSADLAGKESERLQMRTINGTDLSGRVVRVNTAKNIALVKLDTPTDYLPLSLNLDLPKANQEGFIVLGMLDVDNFKDGENFIDNSGKVTGFRYSENRGSEIMLDTNVQTVTIGGVLIDGHGTINGIAHTGEKTANGKDLFLPTETALRSVGLSICEKLYEKSSPWEQKVVKPATEKILESKPVAPEAMPVKDRK